MSAMIPSPLPRPPKRANCISDLAQPRDLKKVVMLANASGLISGDPAYDRYQIMFRFKIGPCLVFESRAFGPLQNLVPYLCSWFF